MEKFITVEVKNEDGKTIFKDKTSYTQDAEIIGFLHLVMEQLINKTYEMG